MKKKTKLTKVLGLLLSAVMILAGLAACGPAPAANTAEASQASTENEPATQASTASTEAEPTTQPSTASTETGSPAQASAALPEGQWAQQLNAKKISSFGSNMLSDYFDEKFLTYISEHTRGNYMTSPLSFRYALGLLLAGAEGETKTELLNALGVGSEEEWVEYCLNFNGFVENFAMDYEADVSAFREAQKQGWIPENTAEPFRALRVANSVWKAEWVKEEFKTPYKMSVEQNYAAEYRTFTPDNAVEKINEWADIKTEHMIPKLLPEDYPTKSLAVVLMNALYFKDSWRSSFEPSETKKGVFHTLDDRETQKEFMHTGMEVPYYEDAATKLIILQMDGGVYMAFVLGATARIAEKISKAKYEEVKITIPKIDLETDFSSGELVNFLKENGVKRAFSDQQANFLAMIDHRVFVSDIIQKTRIKLDEEGVEAAAVTAIMMEECAEPEPREPKEFTADQPFSFYIYTTCNDTTAILFAGEIVE